MICYAVRNKNIGAFVTLCAKVEEESDLSLISFLFAFYSCCCLFWRSATLYPSVIMCNHWRMVASGFGD